MNPILPENIGLNLAKLANDIIEDPILNKKFEKGKGKGELEDIQDRKIESKEELKKSATEFQEKVSTFIGQRKEDLSATGCDGIKQSQFSFIITIVNLLILLLIGISYLLLLMIFLISLINFFLVIVYFILDLLKASINEQFIYHNSYVYNYFNFTNINETNYDNDPLFIYISQYLNINLFYDYYFIFVICLLFIFLIIICGLIDMFRGINPVSSSYSRIIDIRELSCSFERGNLIILCILLIYSSLNYVLYKYFFVDYIKYYYLSNLMAYQTIDNTIYELILTKQADGTYDYPILYDNLKNNEMNAINKTLTDLKNSNQVNKFEQIEKLLYFYNFYKYFSETISLNNEIYNKAVENYLTGYKDSYDVTLMSLISYHEKIAIPKYYEELDICKNVSANEADNDAMILMLSRIHNNFQKINKFIASESPPESLLFCVFIYVTSTLLLNITFIIILIYITGTLSSSGKENFKINYYLLMIGEFFAKLFGMKNNDY
jgi:hypothetical protein